MSKIFTIIIFFLATSFFAQTSDKSADTRQTIWTKFIQPLIEQNRDSVIANIYFPLDGEWGYMMGYKKLPKDLTKNDFIKGYDKLFTKEFLEKTKKQTYKDIESMKHKDGFTEYLFSIAFSKIVDGFEAEGGMILRFKKIKGIYKLYVVQGVGAGPN